MIITCITNRKSDLSQKTLATIIYSKDIYNELKIGELYTVYGISIYNNIVRYLITDVPIWFPADLFHVTSRLLYNEWYFEFYGNNEEGLNALWGYKELLDPTHYQNLLEREPEDVALFEKRKKEMDEYEALLAYIPKPSGAVQTRDIPKSRVYEASVDQTEYLDPLKDFIEKYLNGKIGDQRFTSLYKLRYEQLIDYKKLTPQEEAIMKEFRTVVENYSPDHINPKRVYSNEEEVKAAAQKALACIAKNPYLASLMKEI